MCGIVYDVIGGPMDGGCVSVQVALWAGVPVYVTSAVRDDVVHVHHTCFCQVKQRIVLVFDRTDKVVDRETHGC